MLRLAPADAVHDLLAAARRSDRELDLCLLRVGVLAPADLSGIKTVLSLAGVTLRPAARDDGHCMIEVSRNGRRIAYVHHDGTIEPVVQPTAA
jgi:hypothetical protein